MLVASITDPTPELGLTNLDGVVVKELANTRMNAGEYNVNVDVSDIPTGTYFLTFEYLGVKENQKIVITK